MDGMSGVAVAQVILVAFEVALDIGSYMYQAAANDIAGLRACMKAGDYDFAASPFAAIWLASVDHGGASVRPFPDA
jgi:hypothetical protein